MKAAAKASTDTAALQSGPQNAAAGGAEGAVLKADGTTPIKKADGTTNLKQASAQ